MFRFGRHTPSGRWLAGALTAAMTCSLAMPIPAASTSSDPNATAIDAPSRAAHVLRGSLRAIALGEPARRYIDRTTVSRHTDRIEIAVRIELDGDAEASVLRQLAVAGARVANVDGGTVEAYVAPEALRGMSELERIASIYPIRRPLATATNIGASIHGAADWHLAGFTGAGIKVGIIDLGFSGLPERVGHELPTEVHARCYAYVGTFTPDLAACANGETHGTAVAETIADMAPGVELFVANPISMLDMLSTIAWMTGSGVRVINASWASGYVFEGPGDGTSPHQFSTYALVDRAASGGALWVNAAGNEGQTGWVGAWTDGDGDRVLEWSAGDERNSVTLGAREPIIVAIRWADPWGASTNDYSLQLLNGATVVASSDDLQAGYGDPFEIIEYVAPTAGTYDIQVQQVAGAPTGRLQMLAYTGPYANLHYQVPAGTLPAPVDGANPGMLAVGAVNVASPDIVEPYSSRGPTLDGRIKPDLVAVDCAPTTIIVTFCGTSQATPFVTGAAALLLQADPSLTPAQLAERLRSRTVPIGSPVPNAASGWGRLSLGPVPATAAARLVFVGPTVGAVAGTPLAGQPTVGIVDGAGATVSSGPSSTATVTLVLKGPSGATFTCDGGLSRPAVQGVAYFTGCAVDVAGLGYSVEALAVGLPSIVSAPFEILPLGASMPLVAEAASSTITWSEAVTIRGRLSPSETGAGRELEFERSTDGVRWAEVATGMTDSAGAASMPVRAATSAWYRVCFDGASDLPIAMSYPIYVTVRQKLAFQASVPPPRTIATGRKVTFTTTVRPMLATNPTPMVTFVVYRRIGAGWVLFKRTSVIVDPAGRATLAWTFSKAGSWYVRAQAPATRSNAASAWSPVARYTVR